MQQKTLLVALCSFGAGASVCSTLFERNSWAVTTGASQETGDAKVAPGFSLGFRKELVAELAADVHLNFSCEVQLIEPAGSIPAGAPVRVASYDVALGKVTPNGLTAKLHSRGMWHLDLDGDEAILRTYATSNLASIVNTSELPAMVRFTCRPKGQRTWREVVSKADVETLLEFVDD